MSNAVMNPVQEIRTLYKKTYVYGCLHALQSYENTENVPRIEYSVLVLFNTEYSTIAEPCDCSVLSSHLHHLHSVPHFRVYDQTCINAYKPSATGINNAHRFMFQGALSTPLLTPLIRLYDIYDQP